MACVFGVQGIGFFRYPVSSLCRRAVKPVARETGICNTASAEKYAVPGGEAEQRRGMGIDQRELKSIRLFEGLSAPALRELEAVARIISYNDGQIITLEGESEASVLFVVSGKVRVFRTNQQGREQTLIHLSPGEGFNMPACFSEDHTAPASAMAVGGVRLISIPNSGFRNVVCGNPEIALEVLGDFSAKLRHLTGLAYDLSLLTVRARLAGFLMTQSQTENEAPARWTHEEIAAQLGTVREVISRTLRSLVKDGMIRIDRQRIVILDAEGLESETES